MAKTEDLKVFIASKSPECGECGENLGRGGWITLTEEKGALCLSCADLDHLVFLPSGNAALTRRSKKHSKLFAVVLKWSKARKRYERQGLLIEEPALLAAEGECAADETERARRRILADQRRTRIDKEYVKSFAAALREHYPGCPRRTANEIARHACLKHSGRVGRTAAAKAFDRDAITLAVVAHVRHEKTNYDKLLMSGWDRHDARREVRTDVQWILDQWGNQ